MERMLENIALFDMDGTLCDYESALKRDMDKLRCPAEKPFEPPLKDDAPKYLLERANIIRKSEDWWTALPKLKLGWDILEAAKQLEYRIMILTQGPRTNSAAWSGKMKWIRENLGDTDITITRDKGLVYGKVLVDDYPKYVEGWLAHRPRGLVIMPVGALNSGFQHPQVIRYDGTNLQQVHEALKARIQ